MIVGPKYKICKRLGASVFEKCQTQKFQLSETSAPRGRSKRGGSDFGLQLLEKQKARFTYGLSETQFSRYVHEAMSKSNPVASLLSRLEARLDNVVFRAGFVKTRRAARQLVSHGHVTVNGKRMNVPSHKVEKGDTVAIRTESRTSPLFATRAEDVANTTTPSWLRVDGSGVEASVIEVPGVADTSFNAATIIQFYSR